MSQDRRRESRKVPQDRHRAPGEVPLAPQQQQAGEAELYQDERGGEIEATVAVEQQQQQSSATQRRQAAAQDDDMPSAPNDPGRYDRND
ncbi:hypothetical protein [Altererythrobacter sp. Root672]|uniref:hypothetical protein n=1 Tax=Altererythrobacter sp. Root672 TaxID=1736584 RepID=UPI0006F20F50|nr:hypothetical protein [Altererythrobacter sp. Root672]KRA80462.1 hypothetical protein ASD76_14935 [Altererythrobacter sp. Root672]